MKLKAFLIVLFSFFATTGFADTQIQMEEYGGVYRIPCTVNGAKMKFIFDTGASNVCLSMQMAEYLLDNDYIAKTDIISSGSSTVADGRIVDHIKINLKDIEINGLHLTNIEAVIIDGQNAPLLLGQSAIQKLGTVEINGSLLTIKNDIDSPNDMIDDLFNQARTAYDNKMYSIAMEKYGQLYSMGQLSDYGKYRYAWAALMAENPQKSHEIVSSINDYTYFENEKIDIYRLLGFIYQDLERYNEAANYFELSSNKIQTELTEWMRNLRFQGDCYYDLGSYTAAGEKYNMVIAVFAHINGVDIQYLQKDCINQLKKKQTSYRNDDLDYISFYHILCNQLSGEWSLEGFLVVACAFARAGNKYATRYLNRAGINPYDSYWCN